MMFRKTVICSYSTTAFSRLLRTTWKKTVVKIIQPVHKRISVQSGLVKLPKIAPLLRNKANHKKPIKKIKRNKRYQFFLYCAGIWNHMKLRSMTNDQIRSDFFGKSCSLLKLHPYNRRWTSPTILKHLSGVCNTWTVNYTRYHGDSNQIGSERDFVEMTIVLWLDHQLRSKDNLKNGLRMERTIVIFEWVGTLLKIIHVKYYLKRNSVISNNHLVYYTRVNEWIVI